jgi:hypothetical protein
MTVFTILVFLAALATVVSLASGITAMAHHGDIGHRSSEQWMMWRVVFQAAAVLVILAAIIGS